MEDIWQEFENEFNKMADDEIEFECDMSRKIIATEKAWLDAVSSWKAAGKPRDVNAKNGE